MGDLNINMLEKSSYSLQIKELCATYSFFSLVNHPTRYAGVSNTQIDVCFTNCQNTVIAGTIGVDLSDHLPIFAVEKLDRNDRNIPREKVCIRSYKDYWTEAITDSLLYHDWDETYYKLDDVDLT